MAHTAGEITSSVIGGCKRFECQVIGLPRPSIRWYKDGANITAQARYKFDYTHDGFVVLILENVRLSDQGIYRCSAHNSEGSAETAATLFVTGTRSDIDEELESIHLMSLPRKTTDADEDSVLSMESSFESSSMQSSFSAGQGDLDELANEFEEIAAMFKMDDSKRRPTTDSGITSRGSSFSSEADSGNLAAEMMKEMKEYLHGKSDVMFESFESSKIKSFEGSKADPLTIQGEKYEALSQSIKSLKKFAAESQTAEGAVDIDWDRVKDLEARINAGKSMIEQRRMSKSERHTTSEMETIESSEHFESFSSESSSSVVQKSSKSSKTNYATTMSEFSSVEMLEDDGMLNGHQLEEIKAFDEMKTNGDDLTAKLMGEMKSKKQFISTEDVDDEFSKPRKGKQQRQEKQAGKLDHKVVVDKEGSIMAGKYLLNEAEEVETDEGHSISHELHYMYKAESLEESSHGKVPLSTLLKEAVGFDERLEIQGESRYETVSSMKSTSEVSEAGVSRQTESRVQESGFDTLDSKLSSLDGVQADAANVDGTDSNLQQSQSQTDKSHAGLKYSIDADRSTIKVVEGEEISIRWKVTGISTSQISVYKNSLKISSDGRWEIIRKENSCSLKIFSAISTDAATYCIRVGNSEEDEGKVKVKVTSMATKDGQPEVLVLSDSSEIVAKEKESFKLRWKVTGIEHTKIVIYRNGKKVTLDDRCKLESDGDICTLCVSSAVLDDSATYTIRFNGSQKNYGPIPVKVVAESAAVIQAESSEVLVMEKKTIRIRWTVKGVVHTKITIYKNGKKVTPEEDDRIKTESDGDDFILSVSDASVSDTATYTIGIEEDSIDNAPVVVKVLAGATMQQELEDRIETLTEKEVITHVKEKLKLRWRIKGLRHMKVIVYKNGKVIEADDHTKITCEGDICTLTVDSATMEDSASYTVAVEDLELEVSPVIVKVLPEIKVEVLSDGQEVLATEGELLEIKWKITGVALSEVAIFKDGQPIKLGGRCKLVQAGDVCKLKFPKSSVTDSATYTVRIGVSTENKGQVQAKVTPEVKVEVSAASSEVTVEEGQKLEMKWTITGVSLDKVTVCKNGEDVKADDKAKITFDGDVCTLTYANASSSDAATYSISIDVTYGEVVTKVTKPEPKVDVVGTDSFEAKEGDKVSLQWKVAGVKPADIRLFRNGERIKPNDQYKLRKEGDVYTLVIVSATLEDSASFCIRIGKDGEKDFGKISVKVEAVAVVEETVEKVEQEKDESAPDLSKLPEAKVEILTETTEIKTKIGEKIQMKWKITGVKASEIRLFKNGERIKPNGEYKLRKEEDVYTLVITEVSLEHNADFSVRLNKTEVDQGKITVKVETQEVVEEAVAKTEKDKSETAPDLSKLPESQVQVVSDITTVSASLEEKVQLQWKITDVKPADIKLFRSGERIKPNSQYKLKKDGDVYTLVIVSAALVDNADFTVRIGKSETDSGKITVKIQTAEAVEETMEKAEKDKTEKVPDLSKLPDLKIEVMTETTEINKNVGEKVELQWKITGVSSSEISVYKSGQKISTDDHTKISFEAEVCTMCIESAIAEDTADYAIKVNNVDQEYGKISVQIAIDESMKKDKKTPPEKPKKPAKEIDVLVGGSDLTTAEGKVIELEWKVTGASQESVVVCKDMKKLPEDDRYSVLFADDICTLKIHPAVVDDSAIYSVIVENSEKDEGRIKVDVLKADKKSPVPTIEITVDSTEVTQEEGQDLEVKWKISGTTADKIKVCKAGAEVVTDERVSLSFDADVETMTIKSATLDDSATYCIRIDNSDSDLAGVAVTVTAATDKTDAPKEAQKPVEEEAVKKETEAVEEAAKKPAEDKPEQVEEDMVQPEKAKKDEKIPDIKEPKEEQKKDDKPAEEPKPVEESVSAEKAPKDEKAPETPKDEPKPVEETVSAEKAPKDEKAPEKPKDEPKPVDETVEKVEKPKESEKAPELKDEPKKDEPKTEAKDEAKTAPKEDAVDAQVKVETEEKTEQVTGQSVETLSETSQVTYQEGDNINLEWTVTGESASEFAIFKNGEKVISNDHVTVSATDKVCSMAIVSAVTEDSATYTVCSLTTGAEVGKVTMSVVAKSTVEAASTTTESTQEVVIEASMASVESSTVETSSTVESSTMDTSTEVVSSNLKPSKVTSVEGQELELKWKVSGMKDAEIGVLKDGQDLVKDDHVDITVTEDQCTLKIQPVSTDDSATYALKVNNSELSSAKVSVEVVSLEESKKSSQPESEAVVEGVEIMETQTEKVKVDIAETVVDAGVEITSKTETDIVELKPGMVADTKKTSITTEVSTDVEGDMIKETIETFQETVMEGEFEEGMSMEDVINLQHRETKKEFRVTEDGHGMEISEDIQIVTEVQEEVVSGEGVETITTVTTKQVKTEETGQKMIEAVKDESQISATAEVTEEPKKQKEDTTDVKVDVDASSEQKTAVDLGISTEVVESSKVSVTEESTIKAEAEIKEQMPKEVEVKASVDTDVEASEVAVEVSTQAQQDVKVDAKAEDTQVSQDVSADVNTSAKAYPQDQSVDVKLVEKYATEKAEEVVEEAIESVKKPKDESLKDMPVDSKTKPEQSEKPQEEKIKKEPVDEKKKPEEKVKEVPVTEETEKPAVEEAVEAQQKPSESLKVKTDVSVSATTEQAVSVDTSVTDDVDGSVTVAQKEAVNTAADLKDKAETKDISKVSADVEIMSEIEAEASICDKDKPATVEASVDVSEKTEQKAPDSPKVSADVDVTSETEVQATITDKGKPESVEASVDITEKAKPKEKDSPKVSADVEIKSETEAQTTVTDKGKPESVEASVDITEKAKPKEKDSPKVSADVEIKSETEAQATVTDKGKPESVEASVDITEKAKPKEKDSPKVSADVEIKSETEAQATLTDKGEPESVEASVDITEKAKTKEKDSPKVSADVEIKSETEAQATLTDESKPESVEASVDIAEKAKPKEKDSQKVSADIDIKSETEAQATISDKGKTDSVDTSVDIAKQTPVSEVDATVKVSSSVDAEAVVQDKAKPKPESVEADVSITTGKGKDVEESITIKQEEGQQKSQDTAVSAEAVLTEEESTYESQEMALVPIKIKALPKMEMRLPERPVIPPPPKEGFKCKAFVEGPEIYRQEGEDIRIKWVFSGKEDAEVVSICKDGIKIVHDYSGDCRVNYIIEENYAVLKIPRAVLADSATYCLKLDDKVVDMGQVILMVEPLDRKRDKPSFTRRPAPDSVDGRRLSIRCAVDGYPNPEVTWFLHGEELGQDALFNVYTQDGYHHLGVSDPALLFDEPLVCRIENKVGSTQSVMMLKRDGQEVYCEPVLEAVADTVEEKPRPPTMEAEISETNSANLHKVKVKESYTDQYNFVTLSAGDQVEVLAKNVPGAILARHVENHEKICYVANKAIDAKIKTAAASDVSKKESTENATDASQVNKPTETPENQELLSKQEQEDTTMPERRKLKSPSPQMTSTPKLRRREFGRESPEDLSRRLGFQDSPSPKKEISYDELDIPDYDDGTTRPMFKKRLKNAEAKPGQKAQLECTVSGEPQPKVLWLKNNRPLKESDNCEVIVEDDRNVLVFPNADESDVGTYTARAMNVNGSAMTTAEFTLTEGRGVPAMPAAESPMDMDFTTPTYFFQMSSCEVSEGRMARFDCRVVAYPKPDIVWMRDGKVIDPKERFKLLNFNNEIYSLLIQDVHMEDTGRYTCWARNKFGEAMTEAYLNVIAMQDQEPDGDIAPQFLTKFYDQQTTEGIATEFKAFIAGRPDPDVTWLLNDIELRDAPGQRLRHRDGTVCLEMKAPKVTQSGEYTCILKNKKGEAVCSAKLSVIEDKLQGRMLPKFFKKFDHIKAREGEEVKFTCVVVGEPKPNITWMLDHKSIDVSNRRFIQKQDGDVYTLTIKNLKFEDAGMITCKAVNSEGEVYSSANLHIRESKFLEEDTKTKATDETDSKFGYVPTFTKRLQDVKVNEGNKARFDCKVMGIPNPEVSWMKDGRVIATDHRHSMKREGDYCELIIENVTSSDAGVYTCIISNTQGKSSSTAELRLDGPKEDRYVPEKPKEDKPAKVEREKYSPEPYVKKEPYVKREPYVSPVRPKKKTTFTDKLDTQTFDLPRKSYESSLYTPKYDDYNMTVPKRVYESPIRSYDSPIKTYESPRKTYDSPTRKTYDSPTRKSYESPSRTSYDSPTRRKYDSPTRSYARDEYKRRSLPPPVKRSYSFEEPVTTRYSSPIRTYGLDEPKSYVSPARAYKKEEPKKYVSPYSREEPVVKTYDKPAHKPYVPRRKYSLPTNIYQPESKGPVKPTMPMDRPKLSGKREDSVRLSWLSAPTADLPPDGRRISYIIESRELPRSQWTRVASEVPGTSYMVKHLRPDKEYEFRVRAQNLYGLSEPSLMAPLERRLDDTKKYTDLPEMRAPPRLPTYKPIITDLGEETVRLAWRPAETYEAKRIPPVSYRLEAKELPGKDWMPLTSKLRDTTHYLSDLSKDRDYMIRVRAENDFGISEPTDSLWLQRARAFPTVPISRPDIIDVEDTRAKLAWSRVDIPSFGAGDMPLTYMLEVQEPMKDWRTIARNLGDTEYLVDGLRPGTDYKFRVRAKTPTGALSEPSPAASLYTTLAKARAPVDRLEVVQYEPDNRSIQLSWQRVHIPPYNYEDQPLMYMVEYNEPPMPDWQPLVSGIPTTRYRVTHLDPMRDYKFRVRALTPYGVSPPSPALPVTLRQAPVGYQLPSTVTLSNVEPTAVKLSWQRPMYDLSKTVHYDVEMLEPPFTVWQRLASGLTDTSYKASGLKPTKDYQFRVIPRVDQRQLEPTAPVSLTSTPVKPRLPIDEPRLSMLSPDSCQLSWRPAELPVYHRSNVPIYYKVEMQELPSTAWMPVARRLRDTCYHVTGLRPNKDYKFRITAETDYGMSEPSLPASIYRKPAPKFATNEPLIKDISQNVVQLSWEPADAPSAVGVVSYRVEVQTPPGISTWTTLYSNHASPSVRLADLRPDLDYLVRIRAVCGDYVSEPTLPIYIPRRATPPKMSHEEPYAVDIGKDYVKLQWRTAYIPSQIMDYSPISYRLEAQELPTGSWIPVAQGIAHTDFKVTGLSPLKDYNFRVRAENDYGVSDPTPAVTIKRRSVEPTLPRDEPMLYDVGPSSVRLSWRPASLPSHLQAAAPLYYSIYVQEPPSKSWRPLVRNVPGTSYHLTGLLPEKDYLFRVQAENEHGQSKPTDAVYLPRFKDIQRPISMPEVSDFADDLTSVKLRWKPRAGSPFDAAPNRYLIESWEPVRRVWRPVAKGIRDTSYHLRDLPRTPNHLFRVRYETEKAGLSEPSIPISVSKFYSMPKMPVHRPQLDEVDSDSVRLSWMTTYIADAATRNKVRFYIEQREVPDGTWRTVASDVYDKHYKVRGLKARSDYEFRVKVNVDGVTSEPSYPVSLFRRPVIPKVTFETPEVLEVDDSTISLKWNQVNIPAYNYDDEPLSFMIERQALPGYEWTPVATNITGSRYTIKDLAPFQDYKFRVRGVYASGYSEPSPPVPVYRRPSESKLGYIGVTELQGSQKYSKYQATPLTPLPTESLHSSTPEVVKPKKRVTRRYSSYDMYDSKETYAEASFQSTAAPPPEPKFRRENAYVYRRNMSPVKEPEVPKYQAPEPVIYKELDRSKDLYAWYNKRRASDAGLDLEELRRRRRDSEYDLKLEERRHALLLETENRSRRRPSPVTTPRKAPVVTASTEVGESYASVADRYEDIKCPHIIRPGHWNYPRRRMSVSLDYQDLEKLRQRTYDMEKKYSKTSKSESGSTVYVVEDTANAQHYKKVGHVSRADLVELYPRGGSLSNDRDQGYFVISKFSLSVSGLKRTRSQTPPGRYVRPASVEPSPSIVYTRAKSLQPRTRSLTPDYKKYTASTTQSSYSSIKSEKRSSSTEYMRPRSYSISGPSYDSKVKDSRPVTTKDRPKFNRLVENSKTLISNYSSLDRKCEESLEQSYVGYRSRQGSVSQKRASSIADLKADSRYSSTPRGSVSQSPARVAEMRAASQRRASVSVMTTTRASSESASRAGSMVRMNASAVAGQRRSTISSGVNDDLKIKLDSLNHKLEAQKVKKKSKAVMKVKSFRGEGYVMDDGSWQPKSERLSSLYSKLS